MNNNLSNNNIASKYTEEGFVAPIEVMTAKETLNLRLDFEDAEAELVNQPEKQALLRSYPNRLLPSFDALTRNSKLIDAA